MNKLFAFAFIQTKQGKNLPVNEHDVIEEKEDCCEVLRYYAKKATAAIYLIELKDGWIVSTRESHEQGSSTGHSEPLSIRNQRHEFREDAIKSAVEGIIDRQGFITKENNSCTNVGQQKEAKKIIEWAKLLLDKDPQKERKDSNKRGAIKMLEEKKEERKTVKRELCCKLTIKELLTYSEELAKDEIDRAEMEARKKDVADEFKTTIAKHTSNIAVLVRKLSNKEEYRQVDCYYVYDWENNSKTLFREDTGDLVKVEEIEAWEKQKKLDLDDKGTAPCPECKGKKTVSDGTEACTVCNGHGVVPEEPEEAKEEIAGEQVEEKTEV